MPLRSRGLDFPSRSDGPDRGATFVEWLIALLIFGAVTAGVLRFSISELERAEINAAAIQLAGWLETIQRAATRLPAPGTDPEVAGCLVTFTPRPTGAATGSELARVRPLQRGLAAQLCNPEEFFNTPGGRVESGGGAAPARISVTPVRDGNESAIAANSVVFTPRGTVANRSRLDLVIRHTGTSRAARCVRINAITGLIELGHDNIGGADRCPDASFSEAI